MQTPIINQLEEFINKNNTDDRYKIVAYANEGGYYKINYYSNIEKISKNIEVRIEDLFNFKCQQITNNANTNRV